MYLLKLNKKAEPKFFYYHFTNNIGNQSLKRLNASSTIGALYKDDVKNISIYVPSLCEQQKIASCLSTLDDLITAQTEKIEQLKLLKKGLMQGLFPKVND
jgi:type I restriction enzyme S subunit